MLKKIEDFTIEEEDIAPIKEAFEANDIALAVKRIIDLYDYIKDNMPDVKMPNIIYLSEPLQYVTKDNTLRNIQIEEDGCPYLLPKNFYPSEKRVVYCYKDKYAYFEPMGSTYIISFIKCVKITYERNK